MLQNDEFIGGQFSWFTGIVEDISDPKFLNRVRVRCIGWHSDDTGEVATTDLPWATVMMPTTSASLKGVGSNHSLEIDSWVVGFFRDGPSAQDPLIMGSVATQTGGTLDIPTEAQLSPPTNKVIKTQAGHLIEVDNTADAERINVKHTTGTTLLIDKDGGVHINAINDIITIDGNTTITGTLHATGDISTDAENGITLGTHTHTEVPGTGGSSSPTPGTQETSKGN